MAEKLNQWWPKNDRDVPIPCLHNENFPCDCPLKGKNAQNIREICSSMWHRESDRDIFQKVGFEPRHFGVIAHLLYQPTIPCPCTVEGEIMFFPIILARFRNKWLAERRELFETLDKSKCFVWPED